MVSCDSTMRRKFHMFKMTLRTPYTGTISPVLEQTDFPCMISGWALHLGPKQHRNGTAKLVMKNIFILLYTQHHMETQKSPTPKISCYMQWMPF